MTVLVSVVIPVFNRINKLERVLNSLSNQSFKQFEVIVCDDGSEEDIRSLVVKFEDILQIKYLRIDNSGTPARPRNQAVNLAIGNWISFLDSDDWWFPIRMEVVHNELDDNFDVLYHPLSCVDENGNKKSSFQKSVIGTKFKCEPLKHMALYGNPLATSGVIVKRDRYIEIGGMDESLVYKSYEDFDAWLKLAEAGARFKFLNQILGYYSLSSDSISKISREKYEGQCALIDRHLEFCLPFKDQAKAVGYYNLSLILYHTGGTRALLREHMKIAWNLGRIKIKIKVIYLYLKSIFHLK